MAAIGSFSLALLLSRGFEASSTHDFSPFVYMHAVFQVTENRSLKSLSRAEQFVPGRTSASVPAADQTFNPRTHTVHAVLTGWSIIH